MAGRSAAARRPDPGLRGRVWATLAKGDRLYVLALVGVAALVVGMAMGPLQVYTAAADRVDDLEERRDRLREEVDALEDREHELSDPEEIELLARSELGLVRPGEVPYVVVTPDGDTPRIGRDAGPEAASEPPSSDPWWRRLGRWLGERVGSDG